jgi:hypothetical protein
MIEHVTKVVRLMYKASSILNVVFQSLFCDHFYFNLMSRKCEETIYYLSFLGTALTFH